jgi:putative ABC transport system substrate-binding protein
MLAESHAAATDLGLHLTAVQAITEGDLELAFESAVADGAQALLILPDVLFNAHRRRIAALAADRRLPTMYPVREYVEAGGWLAYGESLQDLHYRATGYVDRILRGAAPGELPMERPVSFDLVVNVKSSERLGITIPPDVAGQVTDWIEG